MKIDLPNQGIPYEWAGLYYVLAKEFGSAFHKLVDERFVAQNVTNWFEKIMERRAAAKQPIYDDPDDPRFLLKETLYKGSDIRTLVPEVNKNWDDGAYKLVKTLNLWSHHKINPTADSYLDLLVRLEDVSIGLGLGEFIGILQPQFERTKQIRDGVWQPESKVTVIPEEATSYAEEVVAIVEEVKRRPPVGHEWIGEPGNRIVELSKATRDVYEKGVSIRSELGDNAEEKITSWLRYYPLGGKLRIDTDGAVLGFNKGIGYLIGWLGEEPGVKKEEPRGFYLPHEYEFVPTDIRDVQTGELLSKVAKEPIDWILNELTLRAPFNAVLNLTIYGDLVYETEKGKELKLANVHKDIWFPNHLTQETDYDK